MNFFISNIKKTCKNVKISNIYSCALVMSDEFIIEELDEIKKIIKSDTISVEYVKSNLSNNDIKKYFYDKFYVNWKIEQFENLIKLNKQDNELINEYLKVSPIEEFKIHIFDYDMNEKKIIEQDYEKYFYSNNKLSGKLSDSIRFKISNSNTKTFEIFKSKNEHFFSVVSRFHLEFVRAIWNGKTVLCLPSYISSMMIQLSGGYKYFASIKDPIEIINKYRSRGFGTIINNYEKMHMIYYNSIKIIDSDVNEKWIKMYNIDIKSKKSIENVFGAKKSSDNIFKPSKYIIGLDNDCFKNVNHITLSNFDDCFKQIIIPSLSTISKFKAINDNGKIEPLMKDVFMIGFNALNPKI